MLSNRVKDLGMSHTPPHSEVHTYQGLKTRSPVSTIARIETGPRPQWRVPICRVSAWVMSLSFASHF